MFSDIPKTKISMGLISEGKIQNVFCCLFSLISEGACRLCGFCSDVRCHLGFPGCCVWSTPSHMDGQPEHAPTSAYHRTMLRVCPWHSRASASARAWVRHVSTVHLVSSWFTLAHVAASQGRSPRASLFRVVSSCPLGYTPN